jgi:hypothetical protein
MAETQETPATPVSESAVQVPESNPTVEIQNDLDDLITSTINDDAKKQKLDFAANSSEAAKKDEKMKARIREKKIPSKIMLYSGILVLILAI